jgi:UDP-N-acetylmuramate--alanine ligase
LAQLGARIAIGHRTENVEGANVVVISSAVKPSNPEIVEAKRQRIPVIPRAEMLGELMRGKTGIAVAGTHGKTTTTSMIATILTHAGLDPTLVIGGKVDSLGGNAKLGQGEYMVAEADESDGSFLHLPATYGVVTNIDNDHLDHYGTLSAIEDAFAAFVGKLPFYGLAAVCGDDPAIKRSLSRWTKPFLTYGFSDTCDYRASDVKPYGMGSRFKVHGPGISCDVELRVPGDHNVLNSMAAFVIASSLGLSPEVIVQGLSVFGGVKRRFDIRWQDTDRKMAIVDDYGHHPTEIAATLAAAKKVWPGRVMTIFQPHRYSRTLHCHDGFLSAFSQSDVVLITDVYAAGEDPIVGVDSESLVSDIQKLAKPSQQVLYVGDLVQAKKVALEKFSPGDLVLCLGAGSITKLPDQLMEGL